MFRIYNSSDPVDTLATSHAWQVDAQGRDVELSVRFVLNQLRSTDGKGSVMGALSQLAHLLNHLQASLFWRIVVNSPVPPPYSAFLLSSCRVNCRNMVMGQEMAVIISAVVY